MVPTNRICAINGHGLVIIITIMLKLRSLSFLFVFLFPVPQRRLDLSYRVHTTADDRDMPRRLTFGDIFKFHEKEVYHIIPSKIQSIMDTPASQKWRRERQRWRVFLDYKTNLPGGLENLANPKPCSS